MKTFAEFMVIPELNSYQKKSFLGRQKIIYSDYLKACASVYESAALIGKLLHKERKSIEKLIQDSVGTDSFLHKNVVARNDSITTKTVSDANEGSTDYIRVNSFSWLIAKSELTKFELKNQTMGFSGTSFTLSALELVRNEKAETEIKKLIRQKVTVDTELIKHAETICKEGFVYGLEYPHSTADMYNKTYELPDVSEWRKLHRGALIFGLMKPHSEGVPMDKKEAQLLTYMQEYLVAFMPDLNLELSLES